MLCVLEVKEREEAEGWQRAVNDLGIRRGMLRAGVNRVCDGTRGRKVGGQRRGEDAGKGQRQQPGRSRRGGGLVESVVPDPDPRADRRFNARDGSTDQSAKRG